MTTNQSFLLSVALALTLGGCTTAPFSKQPVETAATRDATPAFSSSRVGRSETILEFAGRVLASDVDDQKKALVDLHQRLALNKYDLNDRTRVAVMHALSDVQGIRDLGKAQTLLDELSRENDPDIERRTLVGILRDSLMENTRLAKENIRLLQENGRQAKRVHEEQERVEALQQKLEELKTIEKNIVDRKVMDK
jgi:chemotaxis signal transduction protein